MRIHWFVLRALTLPVSLAALVGLGAVGRAQDRPRPAPSTEASSPNRTAFDRDDHVPQRDPSRPPDRRVRTPIPPGFPFGLEWGSWAPAGGGSSGSTDPGFRNTPPQNP